ncbi:hypothetical protein JCM3770_004006 [Rhodotorula araucariae]
MASTSAQTTSPNATDPPPPPVRNTGSPLASGGPSTQAAATATQITGPSTGTTFGEAASAWAQPPKKLAIEKWLFDDDEAIKAYDATTLGRPVQAAEEWELRTPGPPASEFIIELCSLRPADRPRIYYNTSRPRPPRPLPPNEPPPALAAAFAFSGQPAAAAPPQSLEDVFAQLDASTIAELEKRFVDYPDERARPGATRSGHIALPRAPRRKLLAAGPSASSY